LGNDKVNQRGHVLRELDGKQKKLLDSKIKVEELGTQPLGGLRGRVGKG